MSSTNRSNGQPRIEHDYYKTDPKEIAKFINAWRVELSLREENLPDDIIDPCAGGNRERIVIERPVKGTKKARKPLIFEPSGCAYPEGFALVEDWSPQVLTMDIRPDSTASISGVNFLEMGVTDEGRSIISNPPFSLALEFVKRAIQSVRVDSYVAFLMRLAFMESKERNEFLRRCTPEFCFVHSKRMSFTPDGATDSCAYAHFVWRVGYRPRHTKMILLPYD